MLHNEIIIVFSAFSVSNFQMMYFVDYSCFVLFEYIFLHCLFFGKSVKYVITCVVCDYS